MRKTDVERRMKDGSKTRSASQNLPRTRAGDGGSATGAPLSGGRGKQGQAFASLNALLKKHLRRSADGRRVVSNATIADRNLFFSKMVRQLHALGYPLTVMANLKPKHIAVLMAHWEAEKLSASTLQKRFSYLTLLCGWLGKQSMLRPGASYLTDPRAFQRRYAATYDHSWTALGVDPLEKIAEIHESDPAVSRVLRLQHAFGLRLQEASLLNPARDQVSETVLRVTAGTKGGRPRVVPIETDDQRALLQAAARWVEQTGRSMIPQAYDLKQWLTHCHHTLARHGITRRDGLTSHGLRHQYANDRYEELTGEPSPVRGGVGVAEESHRRAQLEVSSRLGHARPGITHAYYGKPGAGQSPPPTDDPKTRLAEIRVQRQLVLARVKDVIGERADGRGRLSPSSLIVRQRHLEQIITTLAHRGCPLRTPESFNEAHVDTLLTHWHTAGLTAETVRGFVQFLTLLCRWLDRPDLALRAREGLKAPPTAPLASSWSEADRQARLDALRAHDPRIALHIELVWRLGLTHRQAGRLQPARAYHEGVLDVLWETPKDQVLRFPITTERLQALMAQAVALLPDPNESTCPAHLTLASWLRMIHDLPRRIGLIGGPGEPTLRALQDPDAPRPIVLWREDYLLEQAGWVKPAQRPPRGA